MCLALGLGLVAVVALSQALPVASAMSATRWLLLPMEISSAPMRDALASLGQ